METEVKSWWIVLLALAVIASACGSSSSDSAEQGVSPDDETVQTADDAEASAPTAAPATTAAAPTTTSAAPTTTTTEEPPPASTVPPEDVDRVYQPLPQSDDPCSTPVEEGSDTFSIFVDGAERPVYVEWPATATDEPPGLVVGLHGAGSGIATRKDILRLSELEPHVFVVPSPLDSDIAFWSETPTFNLDFVSTLFAELPKALCFDSSKTILNSAGQGGLVSADAICHTDIPIQLAVMSLSFISPVDCAPVRDVPIISFNTFDFDPTVGAHWDNRWDPPVPHEVAQTGGIGPVPEDLDEWALRYGCDGPRLEETLPDPDDVLERDSVLFAYPECATKLFAFGLEATDSFPTSPAAFELAWPRILEVFGSILDE